MNPSEFSQIGGYPSEKVAANEQHVNIAEQMAKEIFLNYDPIQQNEMVRTIRKCVSEQRQIRIDEAEKNVAYLKDSFQSL